MATIFLTLDEVLAIHHDQIRRYGGSHGVRDLGLLNSAVFRPQSSFGGNDLYPSVFLKAASLMHSLIFNHAFVDGNKRTSVGAGARFLYLNGYKLKTTQKQLINLPLKVESKKLDLEELSFWLKAHSQKS